MKLKFQFSDRHIIAATISANEVLKIEKGERDAISSNYEEIPEDVIHDSLVASSVISSFSYADAYVNEVYDTLRSEGLYADSEEQRTSKLHSMLLTRCLISLDMILSQSINFY